MNVAAQTIFPNPETPDSVEDKKPVEYIPRDSKPKPIMGYPSRSAFCRAYKQNDAKYHSMERSGYTDKEILAEFEKRLKAGPKFWGKKFRSDEYKDPGYKAKPKVNASPKDNIKFSKGITAAELRDLAQTLDIQSAILGYEVKLTLKEHQ